MTVDLLVEGLCFGEGPRWRDGRLWFSDMHAGAVISVNPAGDQRAELTTAYQPSGLGWLPDGDLLVVAMAERSVFRYRDGRGAIYADLSELASHHCNDMVVDAQGRAYVGNFGFDLHGGADRAPAELIMIDTAGQPQVAARDLSFPNGTVISADGSTLVVAESFAGRLTAFSLEAHGTLTGRRVWADLPAGSVPDGICLDEAGGIWVASPSSNDCLRVLEGGEISHRIELDRGAFACMLGKSADGAPALYILAARDSNPDACRASRSGQVLVTAAPYPGAGWP